MLQQNTVRSIVDQKIMLEMAAVDSIVVVDKEVDMALDQQIEMFVSQSGSEERAEETLGQSLKSFRREFWYEMRDRLTTERYQQTLINKINVNRDDVESFFITYKDSLPLFPSLIKTRHLLIPIVAGEESSNAAYETLVEIKNKFLMVALLKGWLGFTRRTREADKMAALWDMFAGGLLFPSLNLLLFRKMSALLVILLKRNLVIMLLKQRKSLGIKSRFVIFCLSQKFQKRMSPKLIALL